MNRTGSELALWGPLRVLSTLRFQHLVALVFGIAVSWATGASAQQYDVIDLEPPAGIASFINPLALNNRGDALGWIQEDDRLVFWGQDRAPREIIVPGIVEPWNVQLDDLGRVGGMRNVNGILRAFLWQNGVTSEPVFPPGAVRMTELTPALAVYEGNPGNWVVAGNTIISIGAALGAGINVRVANSALFAAGSRFDGNRWQAMMRRPDGALEKPFSDAVNGSDVTVLGDGNHFAGTTGNPNSNPRTLRTWFGSPGTEAIQIVPVPEGKYPGTIPEYTVPNAINRFGELVGYTQYSAPDGLHGYLYQNGQYIDLSALTPGRSVNEGAGINDEGVILVSTTIFTPGSFEHTVSLLVPRLEPPAPPVLSLTQVTNPVALSWTPGVGTSPRTYTLHAGTAPGASNLGVFPMGLATTITATVPQGLRIYVRIVATNRSGSATSNEVSFTVTPSSPVAPVMQPPIVNGSTVQLAWNGPPGAVYRLLARLSPTGPVIVSAPVGAVNSLTVPGVAKGTYFVTAVSIAGGQTSPESNQITVIVP